MNLYSKNSLLARRCQDIVLVGRAGIHSSQHKEDKKLAGNTGDGTQ
jgi:hypothetical protein